MGQYITGLLLDGERWERASLAIQARIRARYLKADCDAAYAGIYARAAAARDTALAAV